MQAGLEDGLVDRPVLGGRGEVDGRLGDAVGQHRVEIGVGRRPG
jgi:hypothetical protein